MVVFLVVAGGLLRRLGWRQRSRRSHRQSLGLVSAPRGACRRYMGLAPFESESGCGCGSC